MDSSPATTFAAGTTTARSWREPVATSAGIRALDASAPLDRAVWLRRWRALGREPFAHPGFGELLAEPGDRVCALVSDSGALLPLRLRRIPGTDGLLDATGPYGYGGPYRTPGSPARQPALWRSFGTWGLRHRVVTAFGRVHPFDDEVVAPPESATLAHGVTIVRSVLADDAAVLADADRKVRKNVRRAIAAGVRIHVSDGAEGHEEFARIYTRTMERRHAGAAYRFDDAFFARIHRELAGCFAYVHATLDGVVVSSELVLRSDLHAYSFLGGTDERAFASRPNELLKLAIVRWCREQGLRDLVLGGGASPGDGIERYKRAFAPTAVRPFRTLRLVLDPAEEARLSAGRASSSFPAYRGATGAAAGAEGARA